MANTKTLPKSTRASMSRLSRWPTPRGPGSASSRSTCLMVIDGRTWSRVKEIAEGRCIDSGRGDCFQVPGAFEKCPNELGRGFDARFPDNHGKAGASAAY